MTRVVKAHLYRHIRDISEAKNPETRRFNIDQTTAASYNLLRTKLTEAFPGLSPIGMKMYWKDSDGDYILFSKDNELRDAVAALEDHIFKIHIVSPGTRVCDECGMANSPGIRHVCRVCPDTELCGACALVGKHQDHQVTKIVRRATQSWSGVAEMPGMTGLDGVDPNEDPELAMAMRLSMEEERVNQQQQRGGPRLDLRSAAHSSGFGTDAAGGVEGLLEPLAMAALRLMHEHGTSARPGSPATITDVTEDENLAAAMRMSLAELENRPVVDTAATPTVDTEGEMPNQSGEDIDNPEYFRSVLENLPGVNPLNEDTQRAIELLIKKDDEKKQDKDQK